MLDEMQLTWVSRIVGFLHLAPLIAASMVPRSLKWHDDLASLPVIHRRMHWVYGGYVFMGILFLMLTTIFAAPHIARGGPLAIAFTTYGTVFWGVRLPCALIFDPSPYLRGRVDRACYALLNVTFLVLLAGFLILLGTALHYR